MKNSRFLYAFVILLLVLVAVYLASVYFPQIGFKIPQRGGVFGGNLAGSSCTGTNTFNCAQYGDRTSCDGDYRCQSVYIEDCEIRCRKVFDGCQIKPCSTWDADQNLCSGAPGCTWNPPPLPPAVIISNNTSYVYGNTIYFEFNNFPAGSTGNLNGTVNVSLDYPGSNLKSNFTANSSGGGSGTFYLNNSLPQYTGPANLTAAGEGNTIAKFALTLDLRTGTSNPTYLNFTKVPNPIIVVTGNFTLVNISLITTNSSIQSQNISLSISGLDTKWFNITPYVYNNVPFNKSMDFSINFSVPNNSEAQEINASLVANLFVFGGTKVLLNATVKNDFTLKIISNFTNKTFAEQTNVTGFVCNSTAGGYSCSVNYTYIGNDNLTLVFTVVNSQNFTVNTTKQKIVPGSSSITQSFFCSDLGTGNFYLSSWKIYRASDTDFLNAGLWSASSERKILAC